MTTAYPSRLRSPPPQRPDSSQSASSVPRPKFDSPELLKAYMKKLLSATFQTNGWPEPKERDRVKTWMKEIGERVKERMLEIQPRGFKYIVLTQVSENRGQGGRADVVCHWEEGDIIAQEMYYNDSLICVCIAIAIA